MLPLHLTATIYNLQLSLVFDFLLLIYSEMLWWLWTFVACSNDILALCLWALILLILNYKMLEFCPKRLRRNEHIVGIMDNLTYDIHVTAPNAHGCITHAFLRLRSILAFLIYFNGWTVVRLINFIWFSETLYMCQHLFFIKYFRSSIVYWVLSIT